MFQVYPRVQTSEALTAPFAASQLTAAVATATSAIAVALPAATSAPPTAPAAAQVPGTEPAKTPTRAAAASPATQVVFPDSCAPGASTQEQKAKLVEITKAVFPGLSNEGRPRLQFEPEARDHRRGGIWLVAGFNGDEFGTVAEKKAALDTRMRDACGALLTSGCDELIWVDLTAIAKALTQPGYFGKIVTTPVVEISPFGKVLDGLVDECSPFGPIHHEVRVLPDGRIMYLSRDVLRPGYGDPPRPQEGDTIGIWDQATGQNKIVWNIFDFISPAERTVPASNRTLPGNPLWGGCERDRAVQDWSHADSPFMAEDGSVLMPVRNLNQVISIAADFESVQWRLGGPGSDFTFPDSSDRFYHPHSAELLPNGDVLLFDNGNTLVLFGSNFVDECCRPFFIHEVDALGEAVWVVEHISPLKPNQYRVYPADSIMGETRVPASDGPPSGYQGP